MCNMRSIQHRLYEIMKSADSIEIEIKIKIYVL